MSKDRLDKFKGNIYYSETLRSSYIVVGYTPCGASSGSIEIKLLDLPDFKSSFKEIPLGHATTNLDKLNEREPIGKMDIMQLVEYFIVPKT